MCWNLRNSIGIGKTRHIPASLYYLSNQQRFLQANTFSVIRNPLERLSSVLLHLRSSPFAYQEEKTLFQNLNISENNLKASLIKVIKDQRFKRQIFINTNVGRSGFSVCQSDYLSYKKKILLSNIFTMEKLDILTEWLSEKLGKKIILPHSNSSQRTSNFSGDQELVNLAKQYLREDYLLYETISEMGGAVFDSKEQIKKVQSLIWN
jgi:hypothetical protein